MICHSPGDAYRAGYDDGEQLDEKPAEEQATRIIAILTPHTDAPEEQQAS